MGKPTHTPGPWAVRGAEVFSAGRRVADCDGHRPYVTEAEDAANARLIAAAPEMSAALVDLCRAWYTAGLPADHPAVVAAEAALGKARGLHA